VCRTIRSDSTDPGALSRAGRSAATAVAVAAAAAAVTAASILVALLSASGVGCRAGCGAWSSDEERVAPVMAELAVVSIGVVAELPVVSAGEDREDCESLVVGFRV